MGAHRAATAQRVSLEELYARPHAISYMMPRARLAAENFHASARVTCHFREVDFA